LSKCAPGTESECGGIKARHSIQPAAKAHIHPPRAAICSQEPGRPGQSPGDAGTCWPQSRGAAAARCTPG
jgi:hypothetical protein